MRLEAGSEALRRSMIASASHAAYLPLMIARRLVRIVTMLALVFAPMSMMGGFATMAQPVAPVLASHHEQSPDQSAHCAEMGGDTQDKDDGSFPEGDCLSDCALTCSAVNAPADLVGGQAILAARTQPRPRVASLRGLSPESVDPPPRTA